MNKGRTYSPSRELGIYIRTAAENSENMRKSLIKEAIKKNWKYEIYNEGSKSGLEPKKFKVLKKMMQDIRFGKLHGILARDISRFGRGDPKYLLRFFKHCQKYHVSIVTLR